MTNIQTKVMTLETTVLNRLQALMVLKTARPTSFCKAEALLSLHV